MINSFMVLHNFHNTDLSKYKRIFAIGCSFTNYYYSTWAHIIGKCSPQAEYFNFALAGTGNEYILIQFNHIQRYYDLCETDLIIILFSTFYRDDYYLGEVKSETDPNWCMFGSRMLKYAADPNYPECNFRGLVIKNMAYIDTVYNAANYLPCDTFMCYSISASDQIVEITKSDILSDINISYDDVLELYDHLIHTPMNNLWSIIERNYFTNEYRNIDLYYFLEPSTQKYVLDYHPTITDYIKFVTHLGVNIPVHILEELNNEHKRKLIKELNTYHVDPQPKVLSIL